MAKVAAEIKARGRLGARYVARPRTRAALAVALLVALVALPLTSLLLPSGQAHAHPAGHAARSIPGARAWSGDSSMPNSGGNLASHGGPVQHTPVVYAIFWGTSWGTNGALTPDAQVVLRFLADVGSSAYANVVRQYSDTTGPIANRVTLIDAYLDTAAPPTDSSCRVATVQDTAIQAEVQAAISAKGWPKDGTNATYFVFTPASVAVNDGSGGCSEQQFCAYHNWSAAVGVSYVAMPYPTDTLACGVPVAPSGNEAGDSLANLAASTLFESITDPGVTSGWFDSANAGIGTKCAWDFSAGLAYLNNGGIFLPQTLYSNANGSCTASFVDGPGRQQAVGVYRPNDDAFFLRNTTTTGYGDSVAVFGPGGCQPLSGDWTGKGFDSIGVYCSSSGVFYLRNSNTPGNADIAFVFGPRGASCQAVVGDWTGKGYDSIGLDCAGVFYLKNSNSAGKADIAFPYGPTSGCTSVAGDWNSKGFDTVGVFCGSTFYLRNTNTGGVGDLKLPFGPTGCAPVVGDWTGKGYDSLGVDCAGTFYLRNSNTEGNADIALLLGTGGDIPLAGGWT